MKESLIENIYIKSSRAIKNSFMWQKFFLENKNKKTVIIHPDYVVMSMPYWQEMQSNKEKIKTVYFDDEFEVPPTA
jgi:hypothetical protein